jgi:diacylglycerol kinase (ATP)
MAFDRIVLIFNPNSTGPAPQLAEELRAALAERLPDTPLQLRPTERAGHARELAAQAAATGCPLIVSVSGDGGYNEVVDGVMRTGNRDAVCAVMAAGNANDHRRSTGERPLVDAIVEGGVRRIDLLRLTVGRDSAAHTRYAHSYIGLGLTPIVAIDLEKGGKGSFKEIVSVVRTFAKFRPFAIDVDPGGVRSLAASLRVFGAVEDQHRGASTVWPWEENVADDHRNAVPGRRGARRRARHRRRKGVSRRSRGA